MNNVESRLRSLEQANERGANGWHVCTRCRGAGVRGMCEHIAIFLSLVPRLEAASDAAWSAGREAARAVLEARDPAARGNP